MSRSYRQPYCKVHVWQEVLGEKKEPWSKTALNV